MESNYTTTDIIELKNVSRASTTVGSVAEELGNSTQWSTDDETTTGTVVENITENILTQINNLTTTYSSKMSNATSSGWREEAMDNLNSWRNDLSNITLSSALTNFQPNNHMITQNSHNTSNTANVGYQPPGKVEALVIICIVAFILVVVAKYLGCHFFACCSSSESSSTDQQHQHQAQRTRIQNVLHRPEYNRPLQYAVYSRPTTAQINQVDARGYGYAGETEEEEMAKVFTRRDDHVVDNPPDYNSLVPPSYATPYNYYTYAGNANASNVGDVQL